MRQDEVRIALRFAAVCFAAALAGAGLVGAAWSFSRVEIGDTIENVEMPTLGSDFHPLLGNQRANVILFFRPHQEHSKNALEKVARLSRELEGKSVHWAAIVSDSYTREDVEATVKAADLEISVLIDSDDTLTGKLGVRLHPVVGITDEAHVLRVYLHFTKINFVNRLRAHILHMLGEISESELADRLNPPRAEQGGGASAARSNLKLAVMLFEAGNLEKALETARKSLESDPKLAQAHALMGAILAAQGNCPEALLAFERALGLDAADPTASEGKKACQGKL